MITPNTAEDVLREIAGLDPMITDPGPNDDRSCYFCSAEPGEEHTATCLWRRARAILGMPVPMAPGR